MKLFLELFLEKRLDFSFSFLIIYKKLKDMTKASLFYKRSYTNGYEQKVNYYLDRLDQEIQNENVDQIKFCKKKLDYFLDRQIEYIAKKQHDIFAERIGIDPK